MEVDKVEAFWTDSKVIDFINQYHSLISVDRRYNLRDMILINKFKEDGHLVKAKEPELPKIDKLKIRAVIAHYYKVEVSDITLKGRLEPYIKYKQIYVYLLKSMTNLTLLEISDECNYKRYVRKDGVISGDNSSVTKAFKTIRDRIDTEPNFRKQIEDIRRLIENEKI